MTYYKVLKEDGSARMGAGRWDLPKDGKPGRWKNVRGKLEPCNLGLHLCRRKDLIYWLGEAIFVAEHDGGEMVQCHNKVVVRRARLLSHYETWHPRTQRLFACDCAERALTRIEQPDPRSIRAIEVARNYTRGEASERDCAAAYSAAANAYYAASASAAAAVSSAAANASYAVSSAYAASAAAAVSSAYAASASAAAAAGAAAREEERAWQTERLFDYLEGRIT